MCVSGRLCVAAVATSSATPGHFLLVGELLHSQRPSAALRRVRTRYPDMVEELGFR